MRRLSRSTSVEAGGQAYLLLALETESPIESTFPVYVDLSPARPIGRLHVTRVKNLTSPEAQQYEAVWCNWASTVTGFRLDYISGLEPATAYELRLEVGDE